MAVLGFWTLTGTIYDATGRPARHRVHVTLPTSYTDVHGQIVARQVAARNPRTQHGAFTLQLPDNVDAAVRVAVDNGPTLYKVIPGRTGDVTWEALEASIGDWEAEAGTLPAGYPTVAEVEALIAAAGGGGGLDTEAVQDVVGGMVVAGDNTTVTYDDAAGTVTIDAAGGLTTEEIQDIIGSTVVAGDNTTVTYDDGAGTVTVSAAAGGLDTEAVQDVVGAMITAGTGTTVTYDDGAGTVTIDAAGGGGGGYAAPPALTLPDAGIETGVTQTTDSVRYGFDAGTAGSPYVYSDTIFTQANPAASNNYTEFENCTFTGHMTITGNYAKFRHCRFEKGLGVSGAEFWEIHDCEFVTTAAKVDDCLHITGDSGECGKGVVARSRFYVDGTLPPDVGIHWDAIQLRGGKWIDIIDCVMECPTIHSNAYNGAVYMENANGGNQGVRLFGCYMVGAWAYTLAMQGPDCVVAGCTIVDPHYGPHYSLGTMAEPSGGLARYHQSDVVLVESGVASRCPMPYLGVPVPPA